MAIQVKKARPVRATGPVHIHSIALESFGAFDDLKLDFGGNTSRDHGQWIVLLGDNGAGKTTLLRAIAFALQGHSAAVMHVSILGHSMVRFGSQEAIVRIDTSRGPGMTRLGPARGIDVMIEASKPPRRVEIFAYGSGRGSAVGGRERSVDLGEHRNAVTLFSAQEDLIHAETWLRREALKATGSKADRERFERLLESLSGLLPDGEHIVHKKDEFFLRSGSRQVPFVAMSDGYLTTLGWTIDLIARWTHRRGELEADVTGQMKCIVLVDELDLHLHPHWQLDIIPRLRVAFPRTTFVVTTHNPLTLQGTEAGEVFVLQRDAETGAVGVTARDVPPGTDANRLLTGDWFGLPSTLDEPTLKLLDDHRALLLTGVHEADPDRLILEAQLRERLNGFADTSIERLAHGVMAEIFDEKLRKRADITDADRQRVVDEVRSRLAELETSPTSVREPGVRYGLGPKPTSPAGRRGPRKRRT